MALSQLDTELHARLLHEDFPTTGVRYYLWRRAAQTRFHKSHAIQPGVR